MTPGAFTIAFVEMGAAARAAFRGDCWMRLHGYSRYATRRFLPVLLMALLAGGGLACKKTPAATEKAAGGMSPAPIRIGLVKQQTMPVEVSAVGTVEPIHSVQVKARVSGPVVAVHFQEGEMVETGRLLFEIDRRPFEVALGQAEANLARAKAQTEQARATLTRDQAQAQNAQAILQRDQSLVDKGMVSPEEFERSRTEAEALRAVVAADEANVKSAVEAIGVAAAAIEQAKLELDYCAIQAPISGKTGAIEVKVGNLVRANDTTPLVTINQIAPIYASFAVPERHLPAIQQFMAQGPLQVKARPKTAADAAPSAGETDSTGQLTFVDNAVNPETGTIPLKATFENADNRLWPGQFVAVTLRLTENPNAIVAPVRAVMSGQQGAYVYVITPDMKAELRPVKVGDATNALAIILEGLQPDEKVVVDGQLRIAPGGPVRILEDNAAPAAAGAPAPPAAPAAGQPGVVVK